MGLPGPSDPRSRSMLRCAARGALLLAVPSLAAAQETKLNGPLVRLTPREIFGVAGSVDGQDAFLWGDLEDDQVFELFRVGLDGRSDVVRVSGALVQGGDVGEDTSALGFERVLALAPGGTRIVYLADQVQDGRVELFSIKPRGGTPVRLNGPLVAGGEVALSASERPFRIAPDG